MKTKTIFSCQSCGYQSPKWVGRCPDCSNWNSFVEEDYVEPCSRIKDVRNFSEGLPAGRQGSRVFHKAEPVLLNSVESIGDKRITTKIGELDRVLGGGIVPGSVTLLAGDPGIGKSTLALQIICNLSRAGQGVLYVSAEESLKQVKLRADRLIMQSARDTPQTDPLEHPPRTTCQDNVGPLPYGDVDKLYLVNQTDLTLIVEVIKKLSPVFVIIDSIQVISNSFLSSSCGSVSQVRECAGVLTNLAKGLNIAMFIIGHVTKEGAIAGPRVLEHIVDTVLYFEGERYSIYRILRAVKNRFGSTNEIGVFEMEAIGLKEVRNPSQIFLTERPRDASGSIVVSAIEGSRPILTEIQALVCRCGFGFPQRRAEGVNYNRLSLLIAVLEKRMGLNLGAEDVFINVAGGIKIEDPACDLGIVISIASSFKNKAIPFDFVALGEVGLVGEVRSVSHAGLRINEAEKLGFTRCILPRSNLRDKHFRKDSGIECIPVGTIREALDVCFS